MLKFQMDAVADKGLVHHLLTECMSFIFSSLFFNKGAVLLVSQLIHMRNHIHCLVKGFI